MEYCIYFFIIGAFLGWLLECTFKFITKNFTRTPGILNTPFCVLYGLGTLVLSVIINNITSNFALLFILSSVVLSVMEYITFILLQELYGIKLWDYSNMTFRINEKVCLEFSFVWGLLGAIYIKYVLPVLTKLYIVAKGAALSGSLYILLAIILVDLIYSSYKLMGYRNKEIG